MNYKDEIELLISILNHIEYDIENKKDYIYTVNYQFNELLKYWKRIKQFTNLYDLKEFLYLYSNKLIDIYCK